MLPYYAYLLGLNGVSESAKTIHFHRKDIFNMANILVMSDYDLGVILPVCLRFIFTILNNIVYGSYYI